MPEIVPIPSTMTAFVEVQSDPEVSPPPALDHFMLSLLASLADAAVAASERAVAVAIVKEILLDIFYVAGTPSIYGAPFLNDRAFGFYKSFKMYPSECPDVSRFTAPLFDSHCHLDRTLGYERFAHSENPLKEIRDATYLTKREFGTAFEGCIANFCDPEYFIKTDFSTVLSDPKVWSTFGVHPKKIRHITPAVIDFIRDKMSHPRVVAFGEFGLDRSVNPISNADIASFKSLLRLALEVKKPIVLHIRSADFIALRSMKEINFPRTWPIHLHCFTSNWDNCQEWLKKYPNLKVGLCPDAFTFNIARKLPLERILLESDAPYFLPKYMLQGRPNKDSHPAMVFHTAQQVAHMKQVSVESVLQANRRNVEAVYGIKWESEEELAARLAAEKERKARISEAKEKLGQIEADRRKKREEIEERYVEQKKALLEELGLQGAEELLPRLQDTTSKKRKSKKPSKVSICDEDTYFQTGKLGEGNASSVKPKRPAEGSGSKSSAEENERRHNHLEVQVSKIIDRHSGSVSQGVKVNTVPLRRAPNGARNVRKTPTRHYSSHPLILPLDALKLLPRVHCENVIGTIDAFCRMHKVIDDKSLSKPEPVASFLASSSEMTKFKGFITAFDDPRDWSSAQYNHLMNESTVWISLGISPSYIWYFKKDQLTVLERYLEINPRVKAIGPIGYDVDLFSKPSFRKYELLMTDVMTQMARVALKWKKPLCLSSCGWLTRGKILPKQGVEELKVAFLRFDGSWTQCEYLLSCYPCCMIGFVENAFHPDVARNVPLDRILFMSNAPEWCPIERTQKQPGMGAFRAAAQFAKVRGIAVENVIKKNEENVRWFYEI